MSNEEYDDIYDGTVKQRSHLRGQVESLAARMPSSDQWENAMLQQRQAEIVKDQQANFADVSGMVDAVNRQQAVRTLDMQTSTASLMKLANGGMVPQSAVDWWNRRYNGDGSGATLQMAGYDKNGDYVMRFADPNGNIQDMRSTPLMQYQTMNNMPGIFSDEDRAAFGGKLIDSGYSKGEIAKYSNGLNVVGGTTISGSQMRALRGLPRERSSISAVGFDGQGGKTNYYSGAETGYQMVSADGGTRADSQGQWKQMSVGPADDGKTQQRVYENTKTGERVTVRDGENPPWKRGSGYDKAELERMKEQGRNERNQKDLDAKRERQQAWLNSNQHKTIAAVLNNRIKDLRTRRATANDDEKKKIDEEISGLESSVMSLGNPGGMFDGVGGAANGSGGTAVPSTAADALGQGDKKVRGLQGKGGSDANGGGSLIDAKSMDEYYRLVESGEYEGHAVSDNTGTHWLVSKKPKAKATYGKDEKKVAGVSPSLGERPYLGSKAVGEYLKKPVEEPKAKATYGKDEKKGKQMTAIDEAEFEDWYAEARKSRKWQGASKEEMRRAFMSKDGEKFRKWMKDNFGASKGYKPRPDDH